MADPVRFFADQHFPGPVVQGLRNRGIDVVTAQEAGRCGAADPDQLAFASFAGRVVLTFDPDFIELHNAGITHAGIAWCPAVKYSIGDLIRALILLHGVLTASEMKNHLEHL